jgi:hypothetical protein
MKVTPSNFFLNSKLRLSIAILIYSAFGRVVRHHRVLTLLNFIINCSADSSCFCFNRAKFVIDTPTFDLAKWDWNFSSISSHELIEFAGSAAYQVNA